MNILLTFSFTISLNQTIIALSLIYPLHKLLDHAPFSFSVVLLQLLVLRCTPTAASFGIRLPYISSARSPRKTPFFCCLWMSVYWTVSEQRMSLIVAHCYTHYPATGSLPRVSLRGNVFIEPLRSIGSICHSILMLKANDTYYVRCFIKVKL
jgi:hypothetical protein